MFDNGATPLLIDVVQNKENWQDTTLLKAVTGAIYKCSLFEPCAVKLDNLNVLSLLMEILDFAKDVSDRILSYVCFTITQLLKIEKNVMTFCLSPQFELVVYFLNFSHKMLLQASCCVLAECSKVMIYAEALDKTDGTRLLWSLLNNESPDVKANAAWALCEYIQRDSQSAEVIRSFVCGIEVLTNLLKSKNNLELSASCAIIGHVAKDEQNVAILTDYNVIPLLAELVYTEDELLQEHLAFAISSCASYKRNTEWLGELRVVTPLVRFMAGTNTKVHRTTAMALEKLSTDPLNCVTMHQSGVSQFLIDAITTNDNILQTAAANCLQNIRKLSLDCERNVDLYQTTIK